MLCSVSGKNLYKAAKLVLKAIDKKASCEGLKAVSVAVCNSHLTLRVYNFEHEEFSIEYALPCDSSDDGFSVVDCKQFASVCESFKECDSVKIEGGTYKNGLRIGKETNQMAIPGVDPMEFPDCFRFRKWHVTAKVDAKWFVEAVKTASNIAESRDYMRNKRFMGVHIEARNNRLYAAGTDGFRFTRAEIKAELQAKDNVTIRKDAIDLFVSAISKKSGDVSVLCFGNDARLECDGVVLESRAIVDEEPFPNVEKAIPEHTYCCIVESKWASKLAKEIYEKTKDAVTKEEKKVKVRYGFLGFKCDEMKINSDSVSNSIYANTSKDIIGYSAKFNLGFLRDFFDSVRDLGDCDFWCDDLSDGSPIAIEGHNDFIKVTHALMPCIQ